MDLDTATYLLKVFVSAFLLCGGVLISLAAWVVTKTYNKAEKLEEKMDLRMVTMEDKMEDEFKKFGVKLAEMHHLVRDKHHDLEVRVVKIEQRPGDV